MDMKEYVKDFGVKGHCKIELTDVRTGEVTMVERDNTISIQHKAYLKMLSCMNFLKGKGAFTTDNKAFLASGSNLFESLVMTDNTEPMDESDIYFKGKLVGAASVRAPQTGTGPIYGTINFVESKWEKDKITLVFDFPTHVANGVIGTVGFSQLYQNGVNIIFQGRPLVQAQGVAYNTGFVQPFGNDSFQGLGYGYDYVNNKILFQSFTRETVDGVSGYGIYATDKETMNYERIGINETYASNINLPIINNKFYKTNSDGFLVERDLASNIERVGSVKINQFWSANYPAFIRNGELYLMNGGTIARIDQQTLNPAETKMHKFTVTSPINQYSTYSPVDDCIYCNNGSRIKFTDLYKDATSADLSLFESVPILKCYVKWQSDLGSGWNSGSDSIMSFYRLDDGYYSFIGQKSADLIPCGFIDRYGREWKSRTFVKLTDYPSDWCTACVLPSVVEKNPTQTMKVTYTLSYGDIWGKEQANG